jgi:peptidoglycan/xylan/chitin deacetylase (PgdA/CDA1 family)
MRKQTIVFLLGIALLAGCSKDPGPDPVDDPRVIILMYHRITSGEATNLYERSMADFAGDLNYLRSHDIRVIDLDELDDIVSGKMKLNIHAAVITFDDGDHSWYTHAVPLLIQHRMKATFFLWASQMGRDSFLTWEEVERMSHYSYEGGVRPFSFGSHTLYHRFLMTMKDALGGGEAFAAYLDEELGGSKNLIDQHISGSVDALALPYGDGAGDEDIIAAARRHGYRFIRTSERNVTGTASSDLFRLPSLPMLDDTPQELIGNYLGIE